MNYASPEAVLNNQWNAALEANITETARRAPHVLMRPRVFRDGPYWRALYGPSMKEGVTAFGETPSKACEAFDKVWQEGEDVLAGALVDALEEIADADIDLEEAEMWITSFQSTARHALSVAAGQESGS